MTTNVFEPTLARQALDELLTRYPHMDVLSIEWGNHDPEGASLHPDWTLVCLGQPSAGGHEAWARWHFAIFKRTGAVYRMVGPKGPVEDPAIIEIKEGGH